MKVTCTARPTPGSAADPALSQDRLQALSGIPLLELTPEIVRIGTELLSRAILPSSAQLDALHIATASFHEVDYLKCAEASGHQILMRGESSDKAKHASGGSGVSQAERSSAAAR